MQDDKNIEQQIFELQAKIENAENKSSGSIEEESRLDDLHCELLKLEEQLIFAENYNYKKLISPFRIFHGLSFAKMLPAKKKCCKTPLNRRESLVVES